MVPATAADATTHRHHHRQQHIRRQFTSLPAQQSPWPQVFAAGTVRQAVPATAAAVARAAPFSTSEIRLGSKRYQRPPPRRPVLCTASNICLPLASLPAPRSPPPLPRLSLNRSSGYGYAGDATDYRSHDDRPSLRPTTALFTAINFHGNMETKRSLTWVSSMDFRGSYISLPWKRGIFHNV